MKRKQLYTLLFSLVFLALSAQIFINFMTYHQGRVNDSGIPFTDFILNFLPRGDFSVYIFGLTYGSIGLFVISRLKSVNEISKFALAGGIMMLTRMATMTLVPLKEPVDIVSLNDPILYNILFNGEITADLFYSGHTAFIFLLYFLSKRFIYLIAGITIGLLVMMQRVHYSIDVAVAIPFAYLIVFLVNKIIKQPVVDKDSN